MDAALIAFILIGLLVGAAIGWLAGSRSAAAAKQVTENLRHQLDEVVRERDENRQAANDLSALRASQEERERSFEARLADIRASEEETKSRLAAQFAEVGAKMLGEAQKQFLERADARFNQAGEKHEEKLKTLLQPVETTLKRYEEGLAKVEKERVDQYAGLREAVELVRAGQGQVRDETRNLVNALRSSPKHRGRWGEQSLRNVLEQAGLSPYADFRTEVSVDGEDGRLRPDVVVRLPGGRQLIIDAKCSLNAYLDACDEVDDDKRAACFRAHVASIRTHAQQLGSKAYWSQFDDSAELVVMYVPGEHFLNAALEVDPTLWEWAFERKVLLATPTNLVVVARTAAHHWEQSARNEAAEEIAKLAKELHSRLATMAEHMARVGKNLATANGAYNQMVGSFESQVLSQARKFEGLGAGSAKSLGGAPMIEASPRPLTKITT
ncbi:MAG: DNA recombination protein RmuC, partial [Pseudomonadota bacterium]|nr:DNA recombination protein RmuC [Pseudomonadota bacterium]